MSKYKVVKRSMDIVGAMLLLVCLSPIMLSVYLLLWFNGGQPIFKQPRLGLNLVVFSIYKFRTMVVHADSLLDSSGMPLQNRVTKLGALLRRHSIDEFPQLINVLKGDMSFIGPRPVLAEWSERFSVHQKRRFNVLPGITGLAQVNGRNNLKWSKRIEFDVFYVENQSFGLDVDILKRTVMMLFGESGVVMDRNSGDVDDLQG